MPSKIAKKLLVALVPLFLLTACGEGYEIVVYKGVPYDGERTAGTGVAYVRIKMLPKKGLDSAAPAGVTPAPAEPKITPADTLFKEKVVK